MESRFLSAGSLLRTRRHLVWVSDLVSAVGTSGNLGQSSGSLPTAGHREVATVSRDVRPHACGAVGFLRDLGVHDAGAPLLLIAEVCSLVLNRPPTHQPAAIE